jgi:hypothetical protein
LPGIELRVGYTGHDQQYLKTDLTGNATKGKDASGKDKQIRRIEEVRFWRYTAANVFGLF